jgi:hypothetical protein
MINLYPVLLSSILSGHQYLGPESIMPIASIIAAVIGFILILWRYILSFIKKIYKHLYYKITRKPIPEPVSLDLDEDDDVLQDVPGKPEQ